MRDVAIPPHLLPTVKAHLRQHVRAGRDALLFPAPTGEHLRSDSRMHAEFRAAREAAGRPDLRFHDLRHTGATLAAATGATLAELMRRLGHANPAAAMRYQHAADDRDAAIVAALSVIRRSTTILPTGEAPSGAQGHLELSGSPGGAAALASTQAQLTLHAYASAHTVQAATHIPVPTVHADRVDPVEQRVDPVGLDEVYDLLKIFVEWQTRPQPAEYLPLIATVIAFLTLIATVISLRR